MNSILLPEKERVVKRGLAELKEQISHFLYQNYIDFDRDVGVKIEDRIFQPSFILRKSRIVIDCFPKASCVDEEYVKRKMLYESDGVKFIILDLSNIAQMNVHDHLRERLPMLGCEI